MAAGMTLQIRDLAVRRGGREIVRGISFSARQGELLALMGVSGTGKTTVLRAIAGLDPIDGGSIDVGDTQITANVRVRGERARQLHRTVGIVFQFHNLFANMTAVRNIELAPVHVLKQPPADAERRAAELLRDLGVAERATAMPHELSGGEAQRVAIARALAVDPRILLMDEPTASLDRGRRDELAATLRQLAANGTTILIATHDADFVRACAERAIVLDSGRVVRDGPAGDVIRATH
jgi:ABC-type polar amino acid transport system ATPase subunit